MIPSDAPIASDAPPYDAVLVVSFGGPEGPDDVIPFLENVLRGKPVPRTPSRFLLDIPKEMLEEAIIKEEGPTSPAEAHAAAEAILAMLQQKPAPRSR